MAFAAVKECELWWKMIIALPSALDGCIWAVLISLGVVIGLLAISIFLVSGAKRWKRVRVAIPSIVLILIPIVLVFQQLDHPFGLDSGVWQIVCTVLILLLILGALTAPIFAAWKLEKIAAQLLSDARKADRAKNRNRTDS